jgi:thiosulfate dehydrogenase [quinone] large subunit
MVPPEGVLLQGSGSRSGALVRGDGRGFNARMQPDPSSNRAWALLIARWILGLIFFMAGFWKVFSLGPLEHARRLFVEPYVHTFLPRWALWTTGTIVPVVELVAGGLLLLGLRIRDALLALGAVLVLVTFGHLLLEPLYEFHTHVIPRAALLLLLLLMPAAEDRFSMDAWLRRRATSR